MAELDKDGTIFVGRSSKPEVLTLALANRHGLVTGATGTGKTVTISGAAAKKRQRRIVEMPSQKVLARQTFDGGVVKAIL